MHGIHIWGIASEDAYVLTALSAIPLPFKKCNGLMGYFSVAHKSIRKTHSFNIFKIERKTICPSLPHGALWYYIWW